MWLLQPAPTPFLVPGATDIQVITTGWGERQISYRTPGRPYGWYFTLAHMLDAQPWILRNPWRPDGPTPTYDPVVPLRFECGYAGVLWDEVVLVPDRDDPLRAGITVRRRIVIPWWRYWPPRAQ